MGTLRVCFKFLKFNVLRAFLSSSLLFHSVRGRFEAFPAS